MEMEGLKLKYFVLKPKGNNPFAEASRQAMVAYAVSIEKTDPILALDLCVWADKESQALKGEKMLILENLKESDKGRWVEYKGTSGDKGRIKSWNDHWVFVVYKCDDNWDNYTNYTGCATSPEDLNFIQAPEIEPKI